MRSTPPSSLFLAVLKQLHDQLDHPDPDPDDWRAYRAVNERFADVIATEAHPNDRVWLHDYHLLLVPRLLSPEIQHPSSGNDRTIEITIP